MVMAENPSTAAKLSTAETKDMAKIALMISNSCSTDHPFV